MMTISTLVGNLNSGLSYLITAVLTASFAVPTVYHKKLILLTLLGSGSTTSDNGFIFNRSSRRKRGMASKPLFIRECMEKSLPSWLSQFSFANVSYVRHVSAALQNSSQDFFIFYLYLNSKYETIIKSSA